MLDVLKFVRGGVSDKDNVLPVLTHFCIYDKRVQGSNGRIHIDSPCIELPFRAVVPAERFLRAVDACKGEPKIRFTDAGKLVAERKPFRATLPTLPFDSFPLAVASAGKRNAVGKGFIDILRMLRPFVGEDASRQWASTILFDAESGKAIAANNAMIAAVAADKCLKESAQIPIFVIDELIRIGASFNDPTHYILDAVSITFFWEMGWLKSQLINAAYPIDTARKWLGMKSKSMLPVPKDLRRSIESIMPFCADPKFPIIYFKDSGISTAPGDVQAEIAGVKLGTVALRADNLDPMLQRADKIAVSKEAVLFTGPQGFKGIMAPLRL